jgi:hypothetical protein
MRWPARRSRRPGAAAERPDELRVGDPRFDDWPVVRDFEELPAARAWRRHLADCGLEAVLTSDWPLDEFGRGDIALRVEPRRYGEADELLSEP